MTQQSSTETFIPSKDASLESSISTLQSQLADIGITVEEKSWLNEVEGIWSVHITDTECKRLFTNGKGGSELAARASALGEYFERLSTNYLWTDYYLGETFASAEFVHYPNEKWFAINGDAWPADLLTPELQAFYNPEGTTSATKLVDLNSGNAERGICAIPYQRLSDDQTVYFPVNLIGNIYVSNGMSAGNSLKEARTQCLSEIFERNIKNKIIAEGICLPDVPEAVINRYPRIAAGIKQLRDAGYGILVKDASLGGQYPVMNVTLLHPEDQGCFASFGAHPRFEVALERTLTELLQGRALGSLTGFVPPSFDMIEVSDSQNLEIHFVDSSGHISWEFLRSTPDYEFVDWNFGTSTDEDYEWCVNKIQDMGFDCYINDFTHLGVYACRIFVPGMSEIYPVEELQWLNNTVGNQVRPYLSRLQDLTAGESAELLELLHELDLADEQAVTILIGLCHDDNTPWGDLRVGEVKTLAALACGATEDILDGCAWLASYNELPADRAKVYRCVADLVQIDDTLEQDASLYTDKLVLMYGQSTVDTAVDLVNQTSQYVGLNNLGSNYEGSQMHQQLLKAYAKVRARMTS